jgi:hypothetical protein
MRSVEFSQELNNTQDGCLSSCEHSKRRGKGERPDRQAPERFQREAQGGSIFRLRIRGDAAGMVQ